MRVLLDECVPRALRDPGHEVKTVAEAGWAGVKNGELLQLAAGQFDLLLMVDRSAEQAWKHRTRRRRLGGLAVFGRHLIERCRPA